MLKRYTYLNAPNWVIKLNIISKYSVSNINKFSFPRRIYCLGNVRPQQKLLLQWKKHNDVRPEM